MSFGPGRFSGLKFAESIVQVLHSEGRIDGGSFGLGMGNRDRWVELGVPNLLGETIRKSFGALGGGDQPSGFDGHGFIVGRSYIENLEGDFAQ